LAGVKESFSDEKQRETRRNPQDEDLEKKLRDGIYRDWCNHKEKGNRFVPQEYVAYMEQNDNAFFCWLDARVNEILIAKGYMGSKMKCLSEYDKVLNVRIDHSTHEALYRNFEESYLPLIKYYNETDELYTRIDDLPPIIAKRNKSISDNLEEYALYDTNEESLGIPVKKIKDEWFNEWLNDVDGEWLNEILDEVERCRSIQTRNLFQRTYDQDKALYGKKEAKEKLIEMYKSVLKK
jgi:hypothetical protein